MARVTCRCGEVLNVKSGGPERIDCPRCGARIRLRRRRSSSSGSLGGVSETDDGYIRFHCPCGRRLKVLAADRPEAGKCPDCKRVVPVPESAWSTSTPAASLGRSDPAARTEDMDAEDLARLEEWSARHRDGTSRPVAGAGDDITPAAMPFVTGLEAGPDVPGRSSSMVQYEAGLRVCPRCGKPVHLSATTCRECGSSVPRR
jgi:hypothetical protein